MQSNRWSPRRLLGLGMVLSLAWLPTACGNSGGENSAVFVPSADGSATGGVTGIGIPGGSGGSGSSGTTTGTTTGTTSPVASPSPGGGGTTGGVAQPSPAAVNTTDMLSFTDNNQRKSPTRMEFFQNLIAVNQGFGAGQANGQILLVDPNAVNGTPAPIRVNRSASSALNETLTNPWDLASDGTSNLLITDGVGLAGQAGRVILVSNFTINQSTNATAGSANATFTSAASANSTAIFNPLFIEPIGNRIILVTEYLATPQGTVRRIDLNTGNSTVVMTGLNFPAGMAADLTNGFLYICQNANANGGANGSLIRVPISLLNQVANGQVSQAIGPSDPQVTVITPASGQPALNRPWECKVDQAGGVIVAEGFALGGQSGAVAGAPEPAGLAQGAIRYVRSGTTVANVVASGLSNCAGLQIQGSQNNVDFITFVESLSNPNGTVRSLRFDINSLLIPTGGSLSYGTGFSFPIDTIPGLSSNGLPLKAAINWFGGAANQGRVVDFR